MNVAVCVKEVPDSSAPKRLDPSTYRLVREGDQVLNAFDTHAIEAALELRESGSLGDDAKITAYCMGPATATRTLQKALALGADEAVHISDEALGGSDVIATARALAAAIKAGDTQLVILGQQAGDSDCWILPGALAEMLGWPVVTQASKLTFDGSTAIVERQTENGYETLASPTPAVITVSDALNEPRYPSLKAIMGAKRKPLNVLDVAGLGLSASDVGDAGSRTAVLGLSDPPHKESGMRIEDEGGNSVDEIVNFLAAKSLV